jgi:hypothetical protein
VSSLNGYECTWRLGFLDAGKTPTAKESVTFKAAGVTVSDPLYKAKVGQPAGAKLVLIGKPVYSTALAGTTFGASQSARLQFPNGAQQEINWKMKGNSASCGGGAGAGTPKYFPTGIQCIWVLPLAAKGPNVTFTMTLHVLGQTKSTQFTTLVR